MTFRVRRASGGDRHVREINTIEDLQKLAEEFADPKTPDKPEDLIVMFNGWGGRGVPTIVIYDDYIE